MSTNDYQPGPKKSREEMQREIERIRDELAKTVDQFSERISPAYQADRIKSAAKEAAADTKVLLTGGGMPEDDDYRTRNVKITLGAAGVVLALVALKVIGKMRG